ncbi:BON domain-containing protein [Paraburkholderia unamae]|jgi:osmotically-inducible protein OsmY|uniref:BON domain-containing protein n=1 Tax=Paraburkholderia unamae TaxID=219649 RepID=UPI000DC2CAB9|nr:BON domain-containing protein [Paraburkholderia unamae]RAR61328.1 BON domain-containing protein [Paraburkholderia unamae]
MNSNLRCALCASFLLIITGIANAQSATAPSDASMAPGATPSASSTTKSDRALARAVRRALSKAPGFNVSGVFVRARDGAVTLSGTVRNGDQIRQAEDVTRSVPGVNSVSNKLTLFHGGNG